MKRAIIFIVICLTICYQLNATIFYVSPTGTAGSAGTTWGTALPDIMSVICPNRVSGSLAQDDDTIFVAAGVYPEICLHHNGYYVNGSIRDSSMLSKLHIFGGFKGNETSLSQRTGWRSNQSIIYPTNGEHGVWFEGGYDWDPTYLVWKPVPMKVEFDGFTIVGTAAGKDALRMVFTAAWISNVQITKNDGLPIFAENLPDSTALFDETMSTTTLINVAVYDNYGKSSLASVMVSASSKIDFRNVTAVRNGFSNPGQTPAIFYFYSNPSDVKLLNTILWDNDGASTLKDNTTGVSLHSGYSRIESFGAIGSNWYMCSDYGQTSAVNPNVSYPYYITPSSSAYQTAYVPFYKKYFNAYWAGLNPPKPWLFYNYDIDNQFRFTYPDKLDIGAWQYGGDSKEGLKDFYFEDTLIYKTIRSNSIVLTEAYSCNSNTSFLLTDIPVASNVYLFDLQGRLLNKQTAHDNEMLIETPSTPGLYFITVENSGQILKTTKLIISK
ncbi:MAG: T9SS type A sorting domain-containing protein [Bacteroidales bacterium]|nr:T9SS type A sorting domain-containing protein [Bacteroidales bacterium]